MEGALGREGFRGGVGVWIGIGIGIGVGKGEGEGEGEGGFKEEEERKPHDGGWRGDGEVRGAFFELGLLVGVLYSALRYGWCCVMTVAELADERIRLL